MCLINVDSCSTEDETYDHLHLATLGVALFLPSLAELRLMRLKTMPKTRMVPAQPMECMGSLLNKMKDMTRLNIWRVVMMIVNTIGPNSLIV